MMTYREQQRDWTTDWRHNPSRTLRGNAAAAAAAATAGAG